MVILDKYNCDLKIESDFYSNSIVKYLVQVLNMNPSNIKYKITTSHTLKPFAFKSFIKYIFDNFEEKQAKLQANFLLVILELNITKLTTVMGGD